MCEKLSRFPALLNIDRDGLARQTKEGARWSSSVLISQPCSSEISVHGGPGGERKSHEAM